jgi:hypothetical protein
MAATILEIQDAANQATIVREEPTPENLFLICPLNSTCSDFLGWVKDSEDEDFKWDYLTEKEVTQALGAWAVLTAVNAGNTCHTSIPSVYEVGDLYEVVDGLYRCKTARTSGNFSINDWDHILGYSYHSYKKYQRIWGGVSNEAYNAGINGYRPYSFLSDAYSFTILSSGAVANFVNQTPYSYETNYGMFITVEGGLNNLAIITKGGIVCNDGTFTNYPFATITPDVNSCHILTEYDDNGIQNILVKFTNDNSSIGLPSRLTVCNKLGIRDNTPFMIELIVICDATSTKTGYVFGRNTIVKNSSGAYSMNTNNYPCRLDNDGNQQTGTFAMAKGDTAIFKLIWDGTNYYAYLNSNQN